MVKPFDVRLLASRIREVASSFENASIAEFPTERESARQDVDEQVTNLFLTFGIPAHIKGYHYLREAVRMALAEPDVMGRITKELYPGIAPQVRHHRQQGRTRHAPRHRRGLEPGRLDAVNSMYGYKVLSADDKPTNGEFIALIADKVSAKRALERFENFT